MIKKKKKRCLFTAEPAENTERRKNHLSRLSALRARGGKQIQNFIQDENAVSEVIGFVLIMGIVLSASSIYFATQVPEWTKDYESRHTADAADDFSELKVLVDGIKGEAFERTTTIKMSPDKVPILGMSPPGSNLDFEPEAEKFEVIVPVGGGGGGSGNWTIPNATHGFTDYYDYDNSNRVSVSDDEVKLSSPTTTDLILDDGKRTELPGDLSPPYIHYYGQVIITNNSVLSVINATGVLRIYASNITVDVGSKIDADGRGNLGGGSEAAGSGIGYGKPGFDRAGGGGAGYGGKGGKGGRNAGSEGQKYGDETSVFIQIGSGGGGGGDKSGGTGGAGGTSGGAIWLDAEEITIDGTISANGVDGESGSGGDDAGGGGGGSGGGILIRGKDVTISGTLSANGGNGGDGHDGGNGGGGGGGGRIKIFYELGSVSPVWPVAGGQKGLPGGSNNGDGGTSYAKQVAYPTSPTDVIYYSTGYFVSTVHDTGNDSVCYGEMIWDATLNGQDLVMKVRTDWNESMAYATHWDDCPELESDDGENEIDLSGVGSVSPAAHRYIQFRAELSTDDDSKTPALTRIKINYSFPAQSPVLANATGSIKFKSNYLHYPNQEIVYEHGAVIKCQREGGFMLQRPPITNGSGIPAIKISLVDLTGGDYSYSGATTTSVKTSYKNYELLADGLKYPNLTINITTGYSRVWGDWFNKTFEKWEWDVSYYNVSVTAENVEVKLYGNGDGVELYLEKTAVEVEI